MAYYGLPEYAPAADCGGNPRFALPSLLHVRKGSKVELFQDNCYYRNGTCSPTTASIVSGPAALRLYDFLEDRWVVAPTASAITGDYVFRVAQGAFTKNMTVRVTNAINPGAPALRVCWVGDSGVGVSGADRFPGIVQAALPSLTAVGTKGAPPYRNEGLNTSWSQLVGGSGGSPFSSGATFNLTTFEAWVTAVGGDCDVMHISMKANDFNSAASAADPSTWPALVAVTLADADEFLAVARAAMPACIFLVSTGWPGNMAPAPWPIVYPGPPAASREKWHAIDHLYLDAAIPHFEGREAEGIRLSPTHVEMNPQGASASGYGDYPSNDAHHFQTITGHPRTARRITNDFVGYIPGLAA
jgi:hypothetical protein